jgi:hypothetical protein
MSYRTRFIGTHNDQDLKEMDCLTCHNRITHLVPQPEDAVDTLLANRILDHSIPEIRQKSVQLLRANYTSQEQALKGIAVLTDYYRVYYPSYYVENQQKIQSAVKSVQEIFQQSVFLEQKSDWIQAGAPEK